MASMTISARLACDTTRPSTAVRASTKSSQCAPASHTSSPVSVKQAAGSSLAALSLSLALTASPLFPVFDVPPASASEFSVLQAPKPGAAHVLDDAGVMSRISKGDLKRLLAEVEEKTGYGIDVVTVRKLTGKVDAFEYADQVLESWYPTIEEGDKRGVVVLITSQKEGALAGGPSFLSAVGDDILEAVVSENLPVLATDEKYNEALLSTAKRLGAKLAGEPDIPGPKFDDNKRVSNFKTKEQTEEKRGQFVFVVGGLLAIAFVVPMVQYYAYVSKK